MIRFVRRIAAKASSLVIQALVRRAARQQGFLDPFPVMERLRHLAQPSEVNEPIELLRAAAVFHARGLINARAIQHNLDWIWPYWVRRQFDPYSESFITRGFSATHVNLTHRNWTAIGLPDCAMLPIVDPRGLVTPYHDGWSIDAWVVSSGGEWRLVPSECDAAEQGYHLRDGRLQVDTSVRGPRAVLQMRAWVERRSGQPQCFVHYTATAPAGAWLVVSARPYNPEGVSPVYSIHWCPREQAWLMNHRRQLRFAESPDRQATSNYWSGDISLSLPGDGRDCDGVCKAGMATAAALYRIGGDGHRTVEVCVPLRAAGRKSAATEQGSGEHWEAALAQTPRLRIPNARMLRLYEQALYSLVLHSADDVFPGPFTYKRFWFRDAAFILNALLDANLHDRVRRCLDRYPDRQTMTGYFHSQDGEWDSNGEAIWSLEQFLRTTGTQPDEQTLRMISRGADWIRRKRSDARGTDCPHAGLLPSGFSAEHLGPNDYYYWDNFWSVAGLRGAARQLAAGGRQREGDRFLAAADELMASVEASLACNREIRGEFGDAYPASPYRRMDSGAVGSLAAAYPLRILPPGNPNLRATVDFLMQKCRVHGGFFQENIHSGINAYLTLHMAQVLLRDGDARFFELVETIADLATPTGQWPEAVHPATGGGCMGDGHHVWASAEWVMMLRNMFVREEDGTLILLSGIPEAWLNAGEELSFGPTATLYGPISVGCHKNTEGVSVTWDYHPHAAPVPLEIRLPGHTARTIPQPEDTGTAIL